MNSILAVLKDIKGAKKIYRSFIYLLILFLSGCHYAQPIEISYHIESEFVWVEEQSADSSLDLSQFEFQLTEPSNSFAFEPGKKLLLKVNFNQVAFEPQSKAFTLVVSPADLYDLTYYQGDNSATSAELVNTQKKYQLITPSTLSGQHYAFHLDVEDLFKNHYFLINASNPAAVNVSLHDSKSFFKGEINHVLITTLLLSLIFAAAFFNLLGYFVTQNKTFLFMAVFACMSLWMLLWQSKTINYLPWLLWPVLGALTDLVFAFIAGLSAFALVYHMTAPIKQGAWLIKLAAIGLFLQLGLLVIAAFNLMDLWVFKLISLSHLFYLLLLLIFLLLLMILFQNKIKWSKQHRLFATGMTLISMALACYVYYLFHYQDLIWLTRLYQLVALIGLVLMSMAVCNSKTTETEEPNQDSNIPAKSNKIIIKQRLITEFQQHMNQLADDTTLSETEVEEKTHIKFHLLLTQAYPIKHSLILTDEVIEGFCTTGIEVPDIEFLRQLALETSQKPQRDCMQKLIGMAGDKQSNVLFVPLRNQLDPNVLFILTLKKNEALDPTALEDIQVFCEEAYVQLCQARSHYQTTLAANLDSLTLCYNRESIETIIKHSLDQKKLTTLAYIDLDNLKNISQQQEVSTSNQLVADFAQKLKTHIDSFAKVGRIGGDKFLVVFSGHEINSCLETLKSFNESLIQHNFGDDIQLTCSTGIAESRMNESTRSLTKKAKTALQHAKQQGGNQMVLFAVDMSAT